MTVRDRKQHIRFFGQYEVTVLGDGRIILPAKVRQQLKHAGGKKIWLAKQPGVKALVICPNATWSQWSEDIKNRCTFLNTPAGARAYLAASEPTTWDQKGRINLPSRLISYAAIKSHSTAVIIGIDGYFELWQEKAFNEMVEDIDGTIRKSMRPHEDRPENSNHENRQPGTLDKIPTKEAADVNDESE